MNTYLDLYRAHLTLVLTGIRWLTLQSGPEGLLQPPNARHSNTKDNAGFQLNFICKNRHRARLGPGAIVCRFQFCGNIQNEYKC